MVTRVLQVETLEVLKKTLRKNIKFQSLLKEMLVTNGSRVKVTSPCNSIQIGVGSRIKLTSHLSSLRMYRVEY